jgi:hypothetical protein
LSTVQRALQFILGVVLGWQVLAVEGATFQLIPTEVETAEGGVLKQQELVTETHRIALRIPPRWGIQLVSSNQSLLILEPNLRAGIEVRLWPQEGQEQEELATWLKRIEERSNGAVMINQFRARSATAEGWGFDLVRAIDRTTRAGLRVILVPYPGGMAEFELRAPAAEVADYYRMLRHLVASFSPRVLENPRRGAGASSSGPG